MARGNTLLQGSIDVTLGSASHRRAINQQGAVGRTAIVSGNFVNWSERPDQDHVATYGLTVQAWDECAIVITDNKVLVNPGAYPGGGIAVLIGTSFSSNGNVYRIPAKASVEISRNVITQKDSAGRPLFLSGGQINVFSKENNRVFGVPRSNWSVLTDSTYFGFPKPPDEIEGEVLVNDREIRP